MNLIEKIRAVLKELIEIGLLLVAVGILLGIVAGPETPFLGSRVLDNVNAFIASWGENDAAGLIALLILAWLYGREDSVLGRARRRARAGARVLRKSPARRRPA